MLMAFAVAQAGDGARAVQPQLLGCYVVLSAGLARSGRSIVWRPCATQHCSGEMRKRKFRFFVSYVCVSPRHTELKMRPFVTK